MNLTWIDVTNEIVVRCPMDMMTSYSNSSKTKIEFNWKTELGIEEMVRHTWRFENDNSILIEWSWNK